MWGTLSKGIMCSGFDQILHARRTICANLGVEKISGLGYIGRGQSLGSSTEMTGNSYHSAALLHSL